MADHTTGYPDLPSIEAVVQDSTALVEVRTTTGDPSDDTQPAIGSYVPSPGTEIESTDPLQFDVTDNLAEFRRIIIEVLFEDTGQSEIAHDGDSFRPYYSGASTRTAITLGFRYVLNRLGGWPADPTVKVYAIDQDGNEGV